MGQTLHGSARTTPAVRRAIQRSQESIAALARRHGIDRKTVAKWRKRQTAEDAQMGPTTPRTTVLSPEEEATVVAFRRHTLLPLDDCLYALQPTIPHLTRSSLHRCLQRHGTNRLPEVEGGKPTRRTFKDYPIGYIHIDFAEVRTEEGKLYLFVAIDRTSKGVYTELHESSERMVAVDFLRAVVAAFPYRLHTVLTGGRTPRPQRDPVRQPEARPVERPSLLWSHLRPARHRAPTDEGRAPVDERSGRADEPDAPPASAGRKEATVKRYHYESHAELREHLAACVLAYNHAKRLKTLRGLTPYEFVCREWQRDPDRFVRDPTQDTLGPYTLAVALRRGAPPPAPRSCAASRPGSAGYSATPTSWRSTPTSSSGTNTETAPAAWIASQNGPRRRSAKYEASASTGRPTGRRWVASTGSARV